MSSVKNYNRYFTVGERPTNASIVAVKKEFDGMKLSLQKVLTCNPYEKMIPFNLWFPNEAYVVKDHYENNQHIRTRYFSGNMLTPLISMKDNSIAPIKPLLPLMSLYQPYYPETFYSCWEFLSEMFSAVKNTTKDLSFLCIGEDNKSGYLEALIMFNEKYAGHMNGTYHYWITYGERYDMLNGTLYIKPPGVNYLGQTFKMKYIREQKQLVKYDFVIIDCIKLSDVMAWTNEEHDLSATLHYVMSIIDKLKQHGSLLIKLNMIGNCRWDFVMDLVSGFFKEHGFFRPSVTNPFNGDLYLFFDKFDSNVFKKTKINTTLLKYLFKTKAYDIFHLNPPFADSKIYKEYQGRVGEWINGLSGTLKKIKNGPAVSMAISDSLTTKWHETYDLKQIKNLDNKFEIKPIILVLESQLNNCKVKPVTPTDLYGLTFYKKLIGKRSELNYYKRIMDTKPSKIFLDNKYSNNNEKLLYWDKLSNLLNVYENMRKNTLKSYFYAELTTNAWLKMYEILNLFPGLVEGKGNKPIKSFHICEAPGAFISALNHYTSNKNMQLEWYAQSLNPNKNKVALKDQLGLISAYPEKWLFGNPAIDDSGNITHSSLIRSYADNPALKDLDIITADGGLKCNAADLNDQEAHVCKVIMGEIICILACLPKGKNAIFKSFIPMAEPLTISMMYLLTALFEKVTITKPCTSNDCNSEVYIVLQNYKGIPENTLEILYGLLDDRKITSKSFLFTNVDVKFMKSYLHHISLLVDRQIAALTKNYFYYYHIDQIPNYQMENKGQSDIWLKNNPMNKLHRFLLHN